MASISIRIDVDTRGFDEAIERLAVADALINGAAIRAVSSSVDVLHDEAISLINKRTGRTAATVFGEAAGLTGYVGSDDKVASILEYGSSPHYIPPRDVPPSEPHPGTPEYAWLLRAGEASEPFIEVIFEEEVGAVIDAL